ncbi:MAG: sugar phosphate isomerase/epimerase family protein [bacterium]|nr:sugar phosphate isomerase/epimerase [Candidatus Sumerlaeota bacterium]
MGNGLCITTDYLTDHGDPSPSLRHIADAGFTHIHWCHHWKTDFIYSRWEISQIRRWLSEYGLRLLDLHGSVGPEKDWTSLRDYERLAGVELVKNRIEMTARLGGEVTIMHIHEWPCCEPVMKSLSELEPFAKKRNVRIAIENGKFNDIRHVFSRWAPDFLGLCYDAGHGNIAGDGLDELERLKDRLISIHLHDNDSGADQHNLLFSGTVDWARLAAIIARSSYHKCASMEVSMDNAAISDETAFLQCAFDTGMRFSQMIEHERSRKL